VQSPDNDTHASPNRLMRNGAVTVLDVRPRDEYAAAHLPGRGLRPRSRAPAPVPRDPQIQRSDRLLL